MKYFCKYIHDTFKCVSYVDVIYIDFAKVFDFINRDVLVFDLKALVLGRSLLD